MLEKMDYLHTQTPPVTAFVPIKRAGPLNSANLLKYLQLPFQPLFITNNMQVAEINTFSQKLQMLNRINLLQF